MPITTPKNSSTFPITNHLLKLANHDQGNSWASTATTSLAVTAPCSLWTQLLPLTHWDKAWSSSLHDIVPVHHGPQDPIPWVRTLSPVLGTAPASGYQCFRWICLTSGRPTCWIQGSGSQAPNLLQSQYQAVPYTCTYREYTCYYSKITISHLWDKMNILCNYKESRAESSSLNWKELAHLIPKETLSHISLWI